MSDKPNDTVTTVVIEMEPGRVYVKISDPKPETDRELLLRRTIEHWFAARPQYVVDRTQTVAGDAGLEGIHVWYRRVEIESAGGPEELGSRPQSFSIEIHELIARQFSHEYLEALIDDALKILPTQQHRTEEALIVVNPRRLAVILNKQGGSGAVIPVEVLEQSVSGPTKAKLQAWLRSPDSAFYLMHMRK